MSEVYQPIDQQVPHTTNDQSLPSPLVHGQQEYDVQPNAVAQQHHQQQQQLQQLPQDEQRVQQQNNYPQYHQGPLQQQQQQQQQPPPQHQQVQQKQYVIYHNQQHQNQYQVLIPQQQQPIGQPVQQQRFVMHQQQPQQHFTHPVVVQQPHMMNQQQQQHVQQPQHMQQQHPQQQQHMQLPQQRQVVVQHQQYQHHPQQQQQQQHQMVPNPQQHYIMVQQQHQQHAAQHQRPQNPHGAAGDAGSIMKRAVPIPVRLGRPQMPQQGQYQPQQQIQQPHQYQQQMPQQNPQQVIQPQQQLVQPQMHGQQPTSVQHQQQPPQKIFIIQNANTVRLSRPGVQVIRGPALPQGAQPRPVLQQHQQGIPRPPMRMLMRHPVVQHPQRPQYVAQGPQVVSMYQPQQVQTQQQQQQQQWIMNGQQLQRPRPPHQQQHPQPQLQFQPGQQPMRMRQLVPPQQQHQPPPFVTPAEIAYNVEHVFNENGREVRKMPIKMGDETIWVDCVESGNAVGDQQQDNGIMLDLMDEPSAPVSGLQLGTPGGAGINRLLTSNQVPTSKTKNLSDEDRDRIISEVVHDQISPAVLGEKYGIAVTQIRTMVKNAGLKLPAKYKQTKMKEIKPQSGMDNLPGSQLQGGPSLPQQQQQQLHPGLEMNSGQHPSMPVLADGAPQIKVINNSGVGQPFNPAQSPAPTQPMVRPVQVVNNGAMTQNLPSGQQLMPQRPGLAVPVKPPPPEDASVVKKVASVPVQYKPKLIPGKSALCKNCGFVSQDFNCCVRCKKPIGENCKTVVDPTFNKGGDDDAKQGGGQSKADLRTVRIQHKPRKKNANDEPECIALSSDEDEEDESDEKKEDGEASQQAGDGSESVEGSKTSEAGDSSSSSTLMPNDDREKQIREEIKNLLDGNNQSTQFTTLTARSIRVGSYKSFSKEKIVFIDKAIQITVPAIFEPQSMATFILLKNDIIKIQAHFGRGIPALFVFASPSACAKIRTTLKMNKATGLWLDLSLSDESMRRITILPERITEETKSLLLRLYNGAIEEIDGQMANDILVKSSPKDSLKLRMMQQQGQQQQLTTLGGATVSAVKKPSTFNDMQNQVIEKYCQFPPTGSNSISVTTEDYFCLEDETFLNDVIIDFFFKWLQFDQMSEIDRNRTHIFSTFFYKRLTMRPQIQKNKLHPIEDDVNLTQAQKRYARVKRWTKSVNIFEKDFIVVPINEHSHWFVAVICFPGLEECRNMETNESCEVPTRQVKAAEVAAEKSQKNKARKKEMGDKKVMQIGSTSIIPLKPGGNTSFLDKMSSIGDEMSDKDEASASDDDLVDEEELTLQQKAAAAILKAKTEELKSKEASAGNSPKNLETGKEEDAGEKVVTETAVNGETNNTENSEESSQIDKVESEPAKSDPESVKNETENVKSETEAVLTESVKNEMEDPAATESIEAENESTVEVKPVDESPSEVKSETPSADVKTEDKSEPHSADDKPEIKSEPLSEDIKPEVKSEPAEDLKTEKPVRIKQPCILIFDSLQTGSRAKVAATLRDYLECEYREKIGKDRVFDKTTIRGCCPKVPQQPNFSDCGIFVLQYIESFFKNPIKDFCLPIIDLRRWFTPDVVRNKRSDVAQTIRDLAAKQNPNKKFDFPSLNFTAESGSGYTDDEDNSDDDSFAPMKRNATLIKVGAGKNSTPTKIPPGIIVTTVGSSSNASAANNRMMSAPATSASFSVTSTSGNMTPANIMPGKGGVVFIKKGNKIDLLPMSGKKHKLLVPKITKPVIKTSVPAGIKVISITNKVKLDKVESPDSATDPEPSTTATSTSLSTPSNSVSSEAARVSTELGPNVVVDDQSKDSSPPTEVVEKMEQDDQVSTNNVTPTKADVDDNSPSSSSGCKRSIAESSSEKSSPVHQGEAEEKDDSSMNGSEAKKAKIESSA